MNTPTLIPSDAIVFRNNQIRTTSLKVAKAFGKRHDNVLRKLQSVECSPDFTRLNFEVSEFTDSTGRKLPMWEMTKDGFIFLVMGFTGAKAAQVKEAYINAFNQMAAELNEKATPAESTPIDVRALLLDGQSDPKVPLPPEVAQELERRAWELAGEAYLLIKEHLQRRVAYTCEQGLERYVNEDKAMIVLNEGDLGYALAHAYHSAMGSVQLELSVARERIDRALQSVSKHRPFRNPADSVAAQVLLGM